jgi:hypothetical protein
VAILIGLGWHFLGFGIDPDDRVRDARVDGGLDETVTSVLRKEAARRSRLVRGVVVNSAIAKQSSGHTANTEYQGSSLLRGMEG